EVNYRFNTLTRLVWRKKKIITVPDDLGSLRRRTFPPTWSSCLEKFDKSLQVLVNHCPLVQALHFASHRHLQVFIQSALFPQIQQLNLQLKEVVIGHLYCIDQHAVTALAETCPLLQTLVIEEPYPLLYRIRPDSMQVCQQRISNLEPGLGQLQEENSR
uniref:Uncharacterized protein n=1 Tax=Plectus sambesii TaxID=2011161 RepID=A0A914UZM1_9BILA